MDAPRLTKTRLTLAGLCLLFTLRVLGQGAEAIWPGSTPIPFDDWSSGTVAYPVLFPLQLLILATMILTILRLPHLAIPSSTSKSLIGLGAIYFSVMLGRFFISLGEHDVSRWLQLPVPSFFHLVLAGFIICVGHLQSLKEETPCQTV